MDNDIKVKPKNSIRSKISKMVLTVSILAVIFSAGVAFIGMHKTKLESENTSLQLGQMAASQSEAALVEQAKNSIQDQAKERAAMTELKLTMFREQLKISASYIADIYNERGAFVSENGEMQQLKSIGGLELHFGFATGDSYPHEAEDSRNTIWYQEAAEKKKAIFTNTYFNENDKLMITCAMPSYDKNNQLIGVLAMDIPLESINTENTSRILGQDGFVFLLDDDGKTVMASEAESSEKKSALNNEDIVLLMKSMTNGEEGVKDININGNDYFIAYAPVESASWSVAMGLPRAEVVMPATESHEMIIEKTNLAIKKIDGTMKAMMIAFVIAFIITVAAVIVATNFFSKRFTTPIQELMNDVSIISKGKLDHIVTLQTGDELEDLGQAFNSMTASLGEYITTLATVRADRERIATELNVATSIQASMLPCIFPAFPGKKEFDIFASMNPAKEVGGDFYDFFLTDDDHLWIVMADVSGKGVPAALFMVITKTMLKNYAEFEKSPGKVLTVVNDKLCETNDADMFVTTFMGVLEISTGKFTFSNAGHNPPLIYSKDLQFEWLKSEPSFVLAGFSGMLFEDEVVQLHNGDKLYLYTDGVTEALNPNEDLYGDDRLIEKLNVSGVENMSMEELLIYLKKDVDEYADGAEQADDITMMALLIK